MVPAVEELHAHDCKDEPEDEAHEEHIDDRRNGTHKSVHDDLRGDALEDLRGKTDRLLFLFC